MKKPVVKESASYDNFLNKKVEVKKDARLPIDVETPKNTRKDLWVGMPEFEQEENAPFKTIYVHFRTEQDFKEFVKKYSSVDEDQTITPKTKSMWYPHLDKDANSLKRYFEQ